jgi:ABC-2 type transport system ATP-binding protein
MLPAMEVKNLVKSFGHVRAVDGLSLAVRPGEIYGLLGPNGSGKTTLIRLITGLLKPAAGIVTVLGQRMPDKRALAAVGYMTQAGALYEDLTVRENITFFARMCGGVTRDRVGEMLALVELQDRAGSLVRQLSGGMKQRVSLACALVHRPRLLLLDEPTVGVDPQLRVSFWEYFQHLAGEGAALLVSSHVMDEAARCHRLGLIRQGRLLAEGTPPELLERAGAASLEEAFLKFIGRKDAGNETVA